MEAQVLFAERTPDHMLIFVYMRDSMFVDFILTSLRY